MVSLSVSVSDLCLCALSLLSHLFAATLLLGPLLKKRWRVAATAVVYFRKFYGSNELQHYDPRLILLSSIFLAVSQSFVLKLYYLLTVDFV